MKICFVAASVVTAFRGSERQSCMALDGCGDQPCGCIGAPPCIGAPLCIGASPLCLRKRRNRRGCASLPLARGDPVRTADAAAAAVAAAPAVP